MAFDHDAKVHERGRCGRAGRVHQGGFDDHWFLSCQEMGETAAYRRNFRLAAVPYLPGSKGETTANFSRGLLGSISVQRRSGLTGAVFLWRHPVKTGGISTDFAVLLFYCWWAVVKFTSFWLHDFWKCPGFTPFPLRGTISVARLITKCMIWTYPNTSCLGTRVEKNL